MMTAPVTVPVRETVLVTGGRGFVGRPLVNGLIEAGYGVIVAGRSEPPPDWFSGPVAFRPMMLDPHRREHGLFVGVSHVVHAAFDHVPGHYRGGEGEDPDGFWRRNVEGSRRLFEDARAAGVVRVVFLSSRAVYDGLPVEAPLREMQVEIPASLYGRSKLAVEQALADLSVDGFAGTSLRLTGVYDGLMPNKWQVLIEDYLAGRVIKPRASTEVHSRDVSQAIRLMLDTPEHLVAGQVFNVSDLVVDRADLLRIVGQALALSHELPERAEPGRIGIMATAKISALGWRPGGRALLEETLQRIAVHYWM
ncbi:NAD(P)-dependent oxidoreductase [Rhizobium sp. 18065]|uniref:NAD-dependent epimerase/dehydratase family protein n=1 Tax=Rhizobium sp. 18065 TaxID=2681411 RepID=UPI001FCE469B|nr:NAD(P)-dependent oxidoreductase [Rhizobium sp. 18065]